MKYVALPLPLIELGKTIPVDVLDPAGKLLLRRGQVIFSEQQKELLRAHQASMTHSDALAWQRSFDRMVQHMIRDGVDVAIIARASMPSEIAEADYGDGRELNGSWLDLQELLLGLLYQGKTALNPLARLDGIERRAHELLAADPDESLFVLFQALADLTLGYSATHALLTGVVCELTAQKLGLNETVRQTLFRAALTMNIGMARAQGTLALQASVPSDEQRKLIREHPPLSFDILQSFGLNDEDLLDLVQGHHELNEFNGLARNRESRRILRMADSFVAKMAPRKTRLAMSPLRAAKSLFLGVDAETAQLGSAMSTVVGFYPPGTYVQLANGEEAVVIRRGARADQPITVSIVNAAGMPLAKYLQHDTSEPPFAIRAPINAQRIKVRVSLEKVHKLLKELRARDA
ncbi:MAG: hypothetical protein KJ614_00240 [Gammaproteobacteria bacterium]|uniref:HD-GYP domain-containing protein n=1 Tax=Rhodoferax sp. TaxID=50421 RepID=UPI00180574E8|nr:HD domain-containing phosphohydrolase [Rhodoferax sp.]MBU3897353.1 hypothetical protein [Gammaproteobacteria bacterium]MBA3058829.1 hypothetical protein [Rhodoferax sp.]MBU3999232.1 hypothetical protein [Gammaproteobacteria bacterium]MBU4018699.1 hypothetical protein [Gammaproteobacteria bacterium]MBU4079654.1 hypothetical protein [Gammaproteobacteria bacterium]